jgi:DNA-binding MarR family transcriptional regulator
VSALANDRAPAVPPRERWPEPTPHTKAGERLTELIVTALRLNGRIMDVAQRLAAEGGLTASWWQVLGGVLDEPRTVAEIGRRMGMTRQGVQRVADLLVEHGLAEYRPNPAHRRAKLLGCTEAGYWAIRRIALVQHPWANRIGAELGADELRSATAIMQRFVSALEADQATEGPYQAARSAGGPAPMALAQWLSAKLPARARNGL